MIAEQIRVAFYGRTASEIRVGPGSFEVDVRLADLDQHSLGDRDRFAVSLPGGGRVPLSAVAEIETSCGVSRIARVDGRRTVTVRGEIDAEATNLNEILALTQREFLPGLLISTVLVLLVVPACYVILHDFGLTTVARDVRQALKQSLAPKGSSTDSSWSLSWACQYSGTKNVPGS